GRHIFIMGNGGSAATASHFVCDLAKGTRVPGKKHFKVIGLTDNIPLLTAWSNDTSYKDVFRSQLENMLEKGDLVIIFTGGGRSPNVLAAARFARQMGAKTISFTGLGGGPIKKLSDICLMAPSNNMERIEDMHLILQHLIKLYLREEIESGRLS
ncbi:MAG: SIS domain-containing protein, partial [Candidatus Margulisbacteria bacterium]|nr:SIS domain-containing protein [Candidatus Margulisiibacteriota bacterium]